jgi:hypothetical protein
MRLSIRLSIVAAIIALGGTLLVGPANANNDPHRVFLPSGPIDLPAGFCAFPTHYDVVTNKEYGTFTTLADGTVSLKESGDLKVRATNVDTNKSILLNSSGPGTVFFFPDGAITVSGQGHWLITNQEAVAQPFGLPGVMVTSGSLSEHIDAQGALTGLSVTGSVMDVCAELS